MRHDVIKNEQGFLRVLLFEQVDKMEMLNFDQYNTSCTIGTEGAYIVAEETPSLYGRTDPDCTHKKP